MEDTYQKYGGEEFWDKLLEEFYEIIVNDEVLKGFFHQKDMDAIKRMNNNLLNLALSSSNEFPELEIKRVHANFGIRMNHFNRFLNLFLKILRKYKVSEDDLEYILVLYDFFREDIVT